MDSYSYTYTGELSLVAVGLGVALVPAMARPPEGTLGGLVARPIADVQAVRHVFAALRRGTSERPLLGRVLHLLSEQVSQLHASAPRALRVSRRPSGQRRNPSDDAAAPSALKQLAAKRRRPER